MKTKQFFLIVNGVRSELMTEAQCVAELEKPRLVSNSTRVDIRVTYDGGKTDCKFLF